MVGWIVASSWLGPEPLGSLSNRIARRTGICLQIGPLVHFFRGQKRVPVEGLEPPLTCVKQILSLSRLPFRHTGGEEGYYARSAARDKEKWVSTEDRRLDLARVVATTK